MGLIDGIAKAVGLAQGTFANPSAKEITERNGAPVKYDSVNRDNFTLDKSPFTYRNTDTAKLSAEIAELQRQYDSDKNVSMSANEDGTWSMGSYYGVDPKLIEQKKNELATINQNKDWLSQYDQRQSRSIDPNAYNLMRNAAEGNAPSQAQLMLQNESKNLENIARRQGNKMFNQNQSMVNSARTYNPGMARAAMFQNASQQADLGGRTLEGQQNLAGQSAAIRAQEMAAARGQYGQYIFQQQGLNDQNAREFMDQDFRTRIAQLGSSQNYEGARLNQGNLNQQLKVDQRRIYDNSSRSARQENNDRLERASAAAGEVVGGAADLAGGGMGGVGDNVSDVRAKKNILPAGSLTDQFAAMTPVTYDYKPGYGGGSHVGVIAQDIERTPVGKNMVGSKDVSGKRVKSIDSKEAVSTLLANAAEQAKRIKELENRTGVGAVSNDDRPSLIATGENHPLTGRPILRTPSGDVATEMGITVTDPRLNGGKPTNLPSIWGMQALGDREAVTEALKSGQKFASYKSIPAAVKASKEHSAELGRYLDESGKVRRDDISNGPIIPAPDGVSIKTNGSTVLVDDNVPGTQFFSPKKKYQGGQTLSPSDAKNLFNVIGAENKRMDRQPAMRLFEQNPTYVPQDAARYGREMMQYAQALKKRPGGIM